MKFLTITAFILISTIKMAFAQPHMGVKESAQLCANALIKKDYSTIMKFTYPKLIEMMGGREQYLKTVKQSVDGLADKGTSIIKAVIGEPGKMYKAGTELHCLVPETMTLKVTDGTVTVTSYLLAISPDKEKTWFFVDTSVGAEEIKKILPAFNNSLIIPPPSQPAFHKDAGK